MTRIEQAQEYAHKAHDSIGQKRKYTGEPYWVHTDAVAALVAAHGGTEDMVIAAHLHDVLEDVWPINKGYPYSAQEIMTLFCDAVMDMVIGLTDVYTHERYPKMKRNERKQKERERIAIEPPFTKTIKLADLINNTESIVAHDPDFAKVYLREKLALLPVLSDGNSELLQRASMQTIEAMQKLHLTIPVIVR